MTSRIRQLLQAIRDHAGWHWLVAILAIVAYRPLLVARTSKDLARDIEEFFFVPSDTSPLLVLGLCVWLLYRRRDRLQALPGEAGPAWLVALLFSLGALVYAWADFTQAGDLLIPSLALNGLGVAILARGVRAARVVALPVLVLLFAMPMPAPLLSEVVWHLQLWSAAYAGWMLNGLGVPTFVSGDLIHQARQTFQVIETCSGLRAVETLTLLSVLMVDLFRRSTLQSCIVIAAAPSCAFAINGVRVVALTLNPHSEILAIHNIQGILILMAGLMVLYALDGGLARVLPHRAREPIPRPFGGHSGGAPFRSRAFVAAGLMAALALTSLVLPRYRRPPPPPFDLFAAIPVELGEWRGSKLEQDRWFLGSIGFQQAFSRRYEPTVSPAFGSRPIELFSAVGDHRQRVRSPFSPKLGVPGPGWVVRERGVTRLAGGRPINWQIVQKRTRTMLVYHWYEGTRGLADEVLRTLLALDSSPLHRPRPGMVFRLAVDLERLDPAERRRAAKQLRRFYGEMRRTLELPWGSPRGPGRNLISGFSQCRKTFSIPLHLS